MNYNGLVSVIMPVFNGLPLIRASIESLLEQTYPFWECIIINDCSTDDTRSFLNSLTDSRFIIHHFEKNCGRPLARQKGLEMARGAFICMLDADDIYHPDKLATQVAIMNEYPDVYLVGAGMCSFGRDVDFIRIRGKGDGVKKLFNSKITFPVTHAPSMLRREHAVKFSYNPALKLGQDLDYLRNYLDGKIYVNLPRVLYYYSEFDSVTKNKIISTYKLNAVNYLKKREYTNFLIVFSKFIYATLYYPLLNINNILEKRGSKPTQQEIDDFRTFVLKKIKNIEIIA